MTAGTIVTDAQIATYVSEEKPLPADWMSRLHRQARKRGGSEADVDITGVDGTLFKVRVRRSDVDVFAFSVILFAVDVGSVKLFRLRRYNGRSHGHRNRIEGTRLAMGFHIHEATERYQRAGFDEDAWASTTGRYSDVIGALECLINDTNCIDTGHPRLLF